MAYPENTVTTTKFNGKVVAKVTFNPYECFAIHFTDGSLLVASEGGQAGYMWLDGFDDNHRPIVEHKGNTIDDDHLGCEPITPRG